MTGPTNTVTTTTVPPLFVDHSDLGIFNQAVAITSHATPGARQGVTPMFWSTDPRPADSPVQEVLELSLSSTRLVNWVQYEVSIYPHVLAVQYYEPSTDKWLPLLSPARAPLTRTIPNSVPSQLPLPDSVPGHLHPQHSFLGHWSTAHLQTKPTYLQRLRFVLKRFNNGLGPTDPLSQRVPYSLAVRNLALGYEVGSRGDVPRSVPIDDTYSQSFASSDDLLGSQVSYLLREHNGSAIIGNADDDADTIWLCEPQPYPGAVVCFYADVRDSRGRAQVIDRIFLNPTNNGSHITVYYANEAVSGQFDSSAIPLSGTQAVVDGDVKLQDRRLHFGDYGEPARLLVANVPAATDVSNSAVLGYDPSLPWWVGATVQPGFTQGIDANEHPIIDASAWRLSLTADGLAVVLPPVDDSSSPQIYDMPFDYGSGNFSVLVTYDGNGHFHLHALMADNSEEAEYDFVLGVPIANQEIPTVYLGGDANDSAWLNSDLINLVLKEELADGTDDFLNNPGSYCSVALFAGDDLPQSHSALLRFDPNATTMINTTYPWGLFGGPAARYENMIWSPVPRDYTMHRGWMYLPPTKAKFFKLEITNLQAIPHDIAVQGPQPVKTFPPQVLQAFGQRRLQLTSEQAPVDQSVAQALSGITPYTDIPLYQGTGGNGDAGYTNTEVYITDDYVSGQRLQRIQPENWSYQTWHVGTDAPRFTDVGVHRYTEETVTRSGKVAYQAGLRQIVFARSSFATQSDTGMYEDPFYTSENLEPDTNLTNWVYDPEFGALTSGEATKATAVSLVYPSLHNLRGVQYAVQQSPPVQLLPDDEFEDPEFQNWNLIGDVSKPFGISTSPVFGTLLQISRERVLGYWGDIAPVYGTYGGISSLNVLYGDLRNASGSVESFGGVASNPVAQPVGGRLYAAARVVADQDLSSPLSLRIIDSVTQVTLAEQSATVKANQVTEWYVGCDVGGSADATGNTWGDVDGTYLHAWESFNDAFGRDASPTLGRLDSGQYWSVPTGGTSLALIYTGVDGNGNKLGLAQVNTAGARDTVDTTTPWGDLGILLGTSVFTATASASVPLLYLGHMLLYNDGRIVDHNTGRVYYTISGLANNDALQFSFMPTAMAGTVPAGVDATVQAWALKVSRNGTLLTTIYTTRAFGTVRGLAGAVGQQFKSFTWSPRQAGVPNGTVIGSQPMPTDGTLSVDGSFWTQANGKTWSLVQAPVFGSNPAYQGNSNTITGGGDSNIPVSMVTVDTGSKVGTLSFRVNQLAATIDPSTYLVAILDRPSVAPAVALAANGNLVLLQQNGTITLLKTGVVPSGSMVNTDLSVKFVNANLLSTAFKTTWSIGGTANQVMIFLANDVVTGVYAPAAYSFASSVRSLLGYNDGAGHVTITTGFGWSTDAAGVIIYTGVPLTWGDVSANGTKTYADLARNTLADLNPVIAEVVQLAASTDTWYQDTLSLFADMITWEFSNDGGASWVPGTDVANNPEAVVAFTPPDPQNSAARYNQLRYRITGWGPDLWVSHLAMRPWYVGNVRDVPPRPAGAPQGPNVNPYDHYPPIAEDSRWQMWHLPIPREWWFAFRQPNLVPGYITPYVTDNVLVR